MQICSVMVRIAGSLLQTVPKPRVTPAEILILQHIHGSDAVVDIRPVEFDETIRNEAELERLSREYDPQAGAFTASPGDERGPLIDKLFPGAVKQLPKTLTEIGMPHLEPVAEEAPRQRQPRQPRTTKPNPEKGPTDKEPEPEVQPEPETDAGEGGENGGPEAPEENA